MTDSADEAAVSPAPVHARGAVPGPPAHIASGHGHDPARASLAVLVALSVCHGLNDMVQSLLPAVYPLLQENYALTFTEIGLIGFAFQGTASLLQPAVGLYTDKRPMFHLASFGMGASLCGLLLLATSSAFWMLLVAAMLIGLGSAVFHPDSSRLARTASGGRFGFAQSLFQVGGNAGTAIGPLLAAFIVVPLGQPSVAWFAVIALAAMLILWRTGTWAKARHKATPKSAAPQRLAALPMPHTVFALFVLGVLIFSKFVYTTSLTSYYTFYLIEIFGVSVQGSQLMLFLFLGAVAAGTYAGGPIGDVLGRKIVIWVSILGALPFTLLLPHANLFWTAILSVVIGFTIASAFSAIVVYAQALVPGRVGLVSGLFFGFAFGLAGLAAAVLGILADMYGIEAVYRICAYLPALGLATALLPSEARLRD